MGMSCLARWILEKGSGRVLGRCSASFAWARCSWGLNSSEPISSCSSVFLCCNMSYSVFYFCIEQVLECLFVINAVCRLLACSLKLSLQKFWNQQPFVLHGAFSKRFPIVRKGLELSSNPIWLPN